jgi:hypothetical protein
MAFFRKIKAGLVKSDFEDYVAEEGQIVFNVETGEFRLGNGVTSGGLPIFTLLQLPDTPSSYLGAAGKFLAVNATEDSLEFVDASSGSSFKLVGSVNTEADLPQNYVGDLGDALVSIDDTHLYIWTGSQWLDIGAAQTPISGFTGSRGITGFTGSQGNIGYTGSEGFTGSTGFVGSKGGDGFTGSNGYSGSLGYTGSRGDTGISGEQGFRGFTGSQGQQGLQGVFGYTGSRGFLGSQGYSGSQGDQGNIGYTGSKGDVGYTGSFGDVGYTGSFGDVGYTGSAGVDGTSVKIVGSTATYTDLPASYTGDTGDGYITLDNGHLNVWTGSSWSDVGNIVGPKGYTGSQGDVGFAGSQGDTGYTGSFGDTGYTGSQGDTGYTGSQGDIGFDGSRGDLGYTGSQGDVGFAGSVGDTGYTGSAGLDGYTGSQGDVGFAGSQGDLGFTGSQGAGFTGSEGDTGFTGSEGSIGYTGSAGADGVIGRDGYTGSEGSIGYTGSAVEGLVSDGVSSITIQSGYTLIFPDGSGQLSAAPRMYTNADAANGLSLSDLKPGDYYYDDVNAAIYICYDTGLGYFDILDLTVRA